MLVVGAGDSGERVVREMKTRSVFNCQPIGFVDDNITLLNQRIHGVRVLGTVGDLPKLVEALRPEMVVVAVPTATPEFLRDLVIKLEPYEISIKHYPQKRSSSRTEAQLARCAMYLFRTFCRVRL
ncbi:MAG: hypothetical protein HC938_11080 [Nitrospira sp.]|nr:hypothetical protein [Nitrospira sp.]